MKYYFPVHLDGGNRGCEGIAKGTAEILKQDKSNLVGLCSNVELDESLGITNFVTVQRYPKWTIAERIKRKVLFKYVYKPIKRKNYLYSHDYNSFLNQATANDFIISTGGDMMCYDDNQVIYTTQYAHERGNKTILWGCSMDRQNLTVAKERTLHFFDLIYARESLSYVFFKELGLENVICLPDPAFVIKSEKVDIPLFFTKGDVIGINLSNLVLGGFSLESTFGRNVRELINYIITQTDFNILLIPHVTWAGQDDRLIAKIIKEIWHNNNRIEILSIENLNYCQIRYLISRCRFFIGGRTHAVISAYSTCVPTIALGYSIKSRGIAKDIGLSDKLVVNSKVIKDNNELLESFCYLLDNEKHIKEHLCTVMPEYRQKPYNIINHLSKL